MYNGGIMKKKRRVMKLFISFLASQLFFLSSGRLAVAKADDLVIEDDGQIVLMITEQSVLGVSTTQKPQDHPPAAPQPPTKVIPLVPAHMESTVQIAPSKPDDKKDNKKTDNKDNKTDNKLEVTITTGPPAPTPSNPLSKPALKNSSPAPLTKVVDQVVAVGKNGEMIMSVKSDQNNHVTISQGQIQATSTVPLKMVTVNQNGTVMHTLRVDTPNGPQKISVLPEEAIHSQQGVLNNPKTATTTLTLENDLPIWKIHGEKVLKVGPLEIMKSPVEIDIDAQTGKRKKISQPFIFSVLGIFVK